MNRQNLKIKGNGAGSGAERGQRVMPGNQRGITAIGMAIILALVAFFALIALRLVPIYLEYFSVSSHFDRIISDSQTKSMTNEEIYNKFIKTFQIDDVENVTRDEIFIDRQGGELALSIEYEVRTPAIGNVDMVVSFSKEAVVK